MVPERLIVRHPPSTAAFHSALHVSWFLWPSFHWYSVPIGMSSKRSPMALWFTNLMILPSEVKSHFGQAAARAILRWKRPTPVAFRKSSKPKVSTHFQVPQSAASTVARSSDFARFRAGAATAAAAVSPSGWWTSTKVMAVPASFFVSVPASSSVIMAIKWSNSPPKDFCRMGALEADLRPPEGEAGLPGRGTSTTWMETTSTPVRSCFFVRVIDWRAKEPMSSAHGTLVPPQKTSPWNRLLSHTWTVISCGMRPAEKR
mmetsp:Transcript_122058/g.340311  ORF Transcript_122058/g.340311 Transcript_122058/m.340311 type:complete len:259 (-) Transcript_122058:139-915(-)